MKNTDDERIVEELLFKEGVFYEDENDCVHVKDAPSTILLTLRDLLATIRADHERELEEVRREERERIYKRLFEMKSVYETMDTGSALSALKAEAKLTSEIK